MRKLIAVGEGLRVYLVEGWFVWESDGPQWLLEEKHDEPRDL